MIWLPTLELLLQLLAILLCLLTGVHIFWTAVLILGYVLDDNLFGESEHDWFWRTKWWSTILVIVILIQKLLYDNDVPLDMFPWITRGE